MKNIIIIMFVLAIAPLAYAGSMEMIQPVTGFHVEQVTDEVQHQPRTPVDHDPHRRHNQPHATPIPGAVWLLGTGIAGLIFARRMGKNDHV